MQLRLEIDLEKLAGDRAKELGRILRYWGGNMAEEFLRPGFEQDLYDSTYAEPVGRLTVQD